MNYGILGINEGGVGDSFGLSMHSFIWYSVQFASGRILGHTLTLSLPLCVPK